ncbi:MAG: class I SAM-dependent methyltransferase [Vampirovibrionia bacterium]
MTIISVKETENEINHSNTSEISDIKTFWKFNNRLGIKNILYGIDYHKCLEYPVAYKQLKLDSNVSTLLDIGTGKHSIFPLYVSYNFPQINTKITDLGSYVFKQLDRIKKIKELNVNYQNSKLIIEKQDATQLTYENNSFDRVSAISSIEHIPNNGDSDAIKEIHRVLKPGGIAVISVPYNNNCYEEKYREQTNYSIEKKEEPVFFSHYYDEEALYNRLINISEFELEKITYLGEKDFSYFNFWCTKVPIRNCIKYFIGWINPIMALKYYRILEETDKNKAQIAVISLIKR